MFYACTGRCILDANNALQTDIGNGVDNEKRFLYTTLKINRYLHSVMVESVT